MSESENPAIASPTPKVANPRTNTDWWPDQIDVSVLHTNSPAASPLSADFDYPTAVGSLNFQGVKQDVIDVMRTSQPWWPADYGHYGPLFIRLTWHAAGTYRIEDGRGGGGAGQQRFAPLNSWPDNGNLDKARRLLWPVKAKHGNALSWADLLVLAGNVAMEDMGFETFGFAFGRPDVFEPDQVNWGTEDTWVGDERYTGADAPLDLEGHPFGAVTMGLIYVNPEGPQGQPNPLASAHDIKLTFSRMAMNSEETVALVAGGHTFGKAHGNGDGALVGPEPEGCPIDHQGLGWKNANGTGVGFHTVTSGIEGAWTPTPTQWDNSYFETLYGYEWELTKSPAGAHQWKPVGTTGDGTVPDAHDPSITHAPMMTTADMALRMDPEFDAISRRFKDNPAEFADAYARAWYKLLHRDMGPVSRMRGPWVAPPQLWQDPVPAQDGAVISAADVAALKARVLDAGLSVSQLVSTAWASASSFRRTDKRGGANGARIRLEPQRSWESNDPTELAKVLQSLEQIQADFNAAGGAKVSLADLIVIGGSAAVEQAAKDAGVTITVAVTPGRTDAAQEDTDVESFAVLEPIADGFRNYSRPGDKAPAERRLLDKAFMLSLSAPEMTVLLGGLRVLGANHQGSALGVLTDQVGALSNDFFVNLLDLNTKWSAGAAEGTFNGTGADGSVKWTATAADLVFGSNSILRAVAEIYGQNDGKEKFVQDFAAAWTKVMDLDRYDVHS
ncbi:catalase/peroxidase HPI [Sporichthya sp.]|uniref:catalase/peroxidase HPI n=1 Tax=Sporichthya sp. TaxID=65475 RepID=UPI001804652C|nr:catalase/peroxidase HPI [Sporichthya sp.]MBA3743776.1 catalase/peroxidase HPI [Sporichthya sp.]